jgi:uncharacterized protein YqgV (UPF0045/DUF77 family)
MNISIEISMYPLQESYIPVIDRFLEQLHEVDQLRVQTNNMSTQVFGPADLVFHHIQRLITDTYKGVDQCPFVIKVLKSDVSENEIPSY